MNKEDSARKGGADFALCPVLLALRIVDPTTERAEQIEHIDGMIFRLLDRIPWQVSGVLGWGGLASMATLAEVSERESPALAASHQTGSPLSLSPTSLKELREHGYLVIDGVLDEAALVRARAECAGLQAAGAFLATDQHEATVRSDSVLWVEEARSPSSAASAGPGLLAVLRRLRALALQLELSPGGWPA